MRAAGIDLGRYSGPVVVVDIQDHYKTGSWGNSDDASAYRRLEKDLIVAGDFEEALLMGMNDLKNVAKSSGTPSKYDDALQEMYDYFLTIDSERYRP